MNDWHSPVPTFQNNIRRLFERLLRKVLNYPKKPAVVLLHAYVWTQVSVCWDTASGGPYVWQARRSCVPFRGWVGMHARPQQRVRSWIAAVKAWLELSGAWRDKGRRHSVVRNESLGVISPSCMPGLGH